MNVTTTSARQGRFETRFWHRCLKRSAPVFPVTLAPSTRSQSTLPVSPTHRAVKTVTCVSTGSTPASSTRSCTEPTSSSPSRPIDIAAFTLERPWPSGPCITLVFSKARLRAARLHLPSQKTSHDSSGDDRFSFLHCKLANPAELSTKPSSVACLVLTSCLPTVDSHSRRDVVADRDQRVRRSIGPAVPCFDLVRRSRNAR